MCSVIIALALLMCTTVRLVLTCVCVCVFHVESCFAHVPFYLIRMLNFEVEV